MRRKVPRSSATAAGEGRPDTGVAGARVGGAGAEEAWARLAEHYGFDAPETETGEFADDI